MIEFHSTLLPVSQRFEHGGFRPSRILLGLIGICEVNDRDDRWVVSAHEQDIIAVLPPGDGLHVLALESVLSPKLGFQPYPRPKPEPPTA